MGIDGGGLNLTAAPNGISKPAHGTPKRRSHEDFDPGPVPWGIIFLAWHQYLTAYGHNDNAPIPQPPFQADILDGTGIGEVVLTVVATDADEGELLAAGAGRLGAGTVGPAGASPISWLPWEACDAQVPGWARDLPWWWVDPT